MIEYFEIRVYRNTTSGERRELMGVKRIYEGFPDDTVIKGAVSEMSGDYAIIERHYEIVPFA